MAVSDTNITIISGRLTRDPEARGGGKVAALSVASNRWYYRNGERVEETLFIDASAFGYEAEACIGKLQKGDSVQLEGRLVFRQYTDRNDVKREKVQLEASRVTSPKFRTKRDDSDQAAPVEDRELAGVAAGASDDDIPF